jgi:hypothetical protein
LQYVLQWKRLKTSFGSYKPDIKIALGSLAVDLGKRPSDLVSWTQEDDWFNRLLFDFDIMSAFHDAENKAQKKAMKRR